MRVVGKHIPGRVGVGAANGFRGPAPEPAREDDANKISGTFLSRWFYYNFTGLYYRVEHTGSPVNVYRRILRYFIVFAFIDHWRAGASYELRRH